VLVGGAGSGKSVFAAQKLLYRAMAEPGHRFAVMRKVGATLRNSVWTLMRSVLGDWGVLPAWRSNQSEMVLTFPPSGSQIICLGLDDPEKLKSIAGVSGFWLEEATEFNEGDLDQVNLRLRGRTAGYKQIVLSFNPISAYHWLKRRFWDTPGVAERARIVRTTYRDNRFLDAEYVREIEALEQQNPSLWRVYGLGEWGQVEGLVYGPPDVLTPWPGEFDDLCYGLDFGFNNPTALLRLDWRDREPWVTERLYSGGLTTRDLIERMPELVPERWAPIYCDAAEPDRIRELCDAGWNAIPAEKGPGSVQAGISFVQGLTIHSRPENTNLNAEFAAYAWSKDRDGRTLDVPVKFADHGMDALRYAAWSHVGCRGAAPRIGRAW
jgi:phage terminase large subunit